MLLQASVEDLKSGAVSRAAAHVVVAMRQYPRGLAKDLRDEYLRELAPEAALFKDFLALKRKLKGDHNYAFHSAGYERRFGLSADGIAALRRLAELSGKQDVCLVCQCHEDQRCHHELLLLLARKWWQAETAPVRFEYPIFEARIRPGRLS
ncbi:MAG: DUF488 family protein [Planctomycetes bacterium]|nr:DUF488 family protein [Planctomycetota bacterium]